MFCLNRMHSQKYLFCDFTLFDNQVTKYSSLCISFLHKYISYYRNMYVFAREGERESACMCLSLWQWQTAGLAILNIFNSTYCSRQGITTFKSGINSLKYCVFDIYFFHGGRIKLFANTFFLHNAVHSPSKLCNIQLHWLFIRVTIPRWTLVVVMRMATSLYCHAAMTLLMWLVTDCQQELLKR